MNNLPVEILEGRIERALSAYLEFPVCELFMIEPHPSNVRPLVHIYGGAVRDALAGMDISDIDLACAPFMVRPLMSFLMDEGYEQQDGNQELPETLRLMYKDMEPIINEPIVFKRHEKVVQLIRPRIFIPLSPKYDVQGRYKKPATQQFFNFLADVDLTCCGVSYGIPPTSMSTMPRLCEHIEGATSDAIMKTFRTNACAHPLMTRRLDLRKKKLTGRGWTEIIATTTAKGA